MKKITTVIGIVSIAMLTGCVKEMNPNNSSPNDPSLSNTQLNERASVMTQDVTDKFVPNEVLVRFVKGTSETGRANALARMGGTVQEHVVTDAMKHVGDNEGFYVVHTPLAVMDAINKGEGAPEIEYAEPNYIYTYGYVTNDTYFTNGSLWGMYGANTSPANQYGSNAAAAWAAGHTGSSTVYVGVIDEGIQYTHPDLSGQVWTNPYDKQDGIDNDGNGYKDDIHGWDFANNDNTIYDGGTNGRLDDHGTHVSGTIAAKSNTAGVVGVNWHVTLISAKFLGRNGGTTANAVKAVDYITNLKTKHGLNIVATNNSWGGGGFSAELYNAIQRASNANILFVAAAGNGGSDGVGDNNDNVANYPSNYDKTNTVNGVTYTGLSNIIAVAAIDKTGKLASFSNYGPNTVHLGAPGVGIYSTLAYNTYGSYSGTSMATPHVTGACALYAATKGVTNNAAQIKTAIVSSAVATSSLSGKTISGGRLDANAALSK